MAWETRKGSGRYYTRSRKVGGRVVREYCGAGLAGEAYEAMDRIDRMERERQQWQERQDRARAQEADGLLGIYCTLGDAITRDALQAAGYHQHHRGEWRKQRGEATSQAS